MRNALPFLRCGTGLAEQEEQAKKEASVERRRDRPLQVESLLKNMYKVSEQADFHS